MRFLLASLLCLGTLVAAGDSHDKKINAKNSKARSEKTRPSEQKTAVDKVKTEKQAVKK